MTRTQAAPVVEKLRDAFLADLDVRLGRLGSILGRLSAGAEDATLLPRLRAELHDLKGTGSSFGFPEVTVIATRAELLAAEAAERKGELQDCLAALRRIVEVSRAPQKASQVRLRTR